MKEKHTPGPWKFLPAFGRVEVEKFIVAYLSLSVESRENPLYLSKGEAEANGRLIEAAPDMLTELKECRKELLGSSSYLATCDPVTIVQNLGSFIASLERRLVAVEAAIRKANGL